ncbi:MAG: SMC-Scp complex subunit ScpB [candidate division Zixibacteria bacterium]|nr:SMC-Scp complex subunit ScpB [candidate division Zixibacteria bacterium]
MSEELNYHLIVEALLFVSDSPLSLNKLKAVLTELPSEKIKSIIEELNQRYREGNQSFNIREIAGGYQMYTLPEFAPWINQLDSLKRAQRLSQAALESLSIIAYRQPVVKSTIDHIRGVDSGAVLHTLLERKLITISGRDESAGRPLIYVTTKDFLIYFGLKDLKELPRIEELESLIRFKDIKELPALPSVPVKEDKDTLIIDREPEKEMPPERIKENI